MDIVLGLEVFQGNPIDASELYRHDVGSLMFAVMYTRPDLAEAVSKLARYFNEPRKKHRHALKRTLRYVRKTRLNLTFVLTRAVTAQLEMMLHWSATVTEIMGLWTT